MRVYGVAQKRGDIKAPSWFSSYLKKELGKDFDCWWVASKMRRVRTPAGFRWVHGSWAVFQRIDVAQRGTGLLSGVSVVRPAWVDVMTLDGNYGLPTGIGRWVVHSLKHCDITRRGNHNRLRQMDELNADDTKREYLARKKAAEEVANDKLYRRLARKIDEDRGAETMSGDEKKAMNAWERRREKQFMDEMEREQKLARYYGTK